MSDHPLTLPHILIENAKKFHPSKAAIREKDYGIWQEISWKEYGRHARHFCLGLISLGLKRGERRVAEADPEVSPEDAEQMIQRAYSIASSSRMGEYLEFYISLVASGELTPR